MQPVGRKTAREPRKTTSFSRFPLDLLQKIGVELTNHAKTELAEAAAANHVNAQTALAQGITAEHGGTVVAALSYYYQAAAFDSSLLEAANRAGVISAAISSGNIGENVRNDIQRRKEWVKILDEAANFFKEHLPWEIIYDPTLTQGKINYSRETVDMSFNVVVRPTDGWKIVQSLIDGLDATGKRDEWDITGWPVTSKVFADIGNSTGITQYYSKQTNITCSLFNDAGKRLASKTIDCTNTVGICRTNPYTHPVSFDYYISPVPELTKVIFANVNANDITDAMTVKIISINGIDAERALRDGYIRITTAKFL